jgi:predicted dehydrogenase
VIGSKKMASFNDVSKKLLLYDQRVEVKEGEPIPIKGDGEEVAYSGEEPLKAECQAFLTALETREAPLTDGQSGLDVLRVLQAAQRSLIMNGQQVTISENNLRPTNGNGTRMIRVVDEFVEEHGNGQS